jgi:hypothetical protein
MAKLLERAGEQAGYEFTKELNEIVHHYHSNLSIHPIYFFRLTLAINKPDVSM